MGTPRLPVGDPTAQARCPREQPEDTPVTHTASTHSPDAHATPRLLCSPHAPASRRLALTVLAGLLFGAALLASGLDGLIPFGLLLAFSTDSPRREITRSVTLSRRNLAVFAVMASALTWFWLWHGQLTVPTLLMTAGLGIALPLTLEDSEAPAHGEPSRSPIVVSSWHLGLVVLVDRTSRTGRASTC